MPGKKLGLLAAAGLLIFILQLTFGAGCGSSTPDTGTTTTTAAGETTTTTSGSGTTTTTSASGTTTVAATTSTTIPTSTTTTSSTSTSTSSTTTTTGASGALDLNFNGQGYVTAHNISGGNATDEANDMLIDSSGNILVVGSSAKADNTLTLVLLRYNSSGQLDTSFSGDGLAATEGDTSSGTEVGNAIALDSSGRILAAGYFVSGESSIAVWRFTAAGSLDSTFAGAGAGVQSQDNGKNGDQTIGLDVAVDSANRIIVSGYEDNASNKLYGVIYRLSSSGFPDAAFGTDGSIVEWGNGTDNLVTTAIAINTSNKIIGTGYTDELGDDDMLLYRLTSTGLDPTFSGDGVVTDHDAAGGNLHDVGLAIALESSSKIIVTGYSTGTGNILDMALWRYSSTGAADTSFSSNGVATYHGTDNSAGQAIALDSSGKILVAGFITNASGNTDMAVWRYNSDGAIDTTFASNGIFTHDGAAGSANSDDQATAIAVDSNGKIVVAGISSHPTRKNDIVVWRINP